MFGILGWIIFGLIVGLIEQPAAVGLALTLQDAHGVGHARVGLDSGFPEVVEGAKARGVAAAGAPSGDRG